MKVSWLIFELGNLQVFTYLTAEEIAAKTEKYTTVYWQDKISKHTYGPFPSVYDCMTHYTTLIASQKTPLIGEQWHAPIIYVDFKKKAKITYGS